jgi:phosphosulfolactate phosphohydrolase-like enzyme
MKKSRINIVELRLNQIQKIFEIKTQDLRVKLISDLERMFDMVTKIAQSSHTENPEDWVKIAGYIAQVINSLADSYDEVRLNEQLKRLKELVEAAKKRAGQIGEGTPIS